jgi:hypothetical protein
LIVVEELHDFVSGRVPISEVRKATVNNVEAQPHAWGVDDIWWGNPEEEKWGQEARNNIDPIKGKWKTGRGSGFTGAGHYCGTTGHRANECNKKLRILGPKGWAGNPRDTRGDTKA